MFIEEMENCLQHTLEKDSTSLSLSAVFLYNYFIAERRMIWNSSFDVLLH